MAELFRKIILAVISVALFAALATFGYSTFNAQRTTIELLERDLNNVKSMLKRTRDLLEKARGELDEASHKSSWLSKENADLIEKLDQQRRYLAEIEQTRQNLKSQIEMYLSQKKALEARLTEERQRTQRQLSLKEKEFYQKLNSQKESFLAEKEALGKQIEASEAILNNIRRENEILVAALNKNKAMLDELRKDKMAIKLSRLNKVIDEMAKENEKYVTELNKNKAMLDRLQKEKSKLQDELTRVKEWLRQQKLKFHYNLGLSYDESRRFREALAEYKKALEIAPDDPDVHYNLGVLYDEHIKDKKKAIYHYQTYLKLLPQAEDAQKVARWIKKAEEELKFKKDSFR